MTLFLDPTGASHPSFTVHPTTGAKESKEMLQKEEGILYLGLDLENCIEKKLYQ